MSAHFFEIRHGFRRERGLNYIASFPRVAFGRAFKRKDLPGLLHDPFGEEKTGGEFEVVARRAHRDAQGVVADADFERLFGGETIVFAAELSIVPFGHLREPDAANRPRHGHYPRTFGVSVRTLKSVPQRVKPQEPCNRYGTAEDPANKV